MRPVTLAVAVAVLSSCSGDRPSAAPRTQGRYELIAAVWNSPKPAHRRLMAVDPDHLQPQPAVVAVEKDGCAVEFSPDGRQYAYFTRGSLRRIFVSEIAIGEPRPLLPDFPDSHFMPVFSPDGSRIAFVAESDDGNRDVYVVASDGGKPVRLTHHEANDQFPTWTADGRSICFASARPGTPQLFRVRPDGSDLQLMAPINPRCWTQAAWAPDGKSFVYVALAAGETRQLFTANAEGTFLRQLTNRGAANLYPVFSPDGRYLAFTRYDDWGPDPAIRGTLVIYDVQKKTETTVLPNQVAKHVCGRPAWRAVSPAENATGP